MDESEEEKYKRLKATPMNKLMLADLKFIYDYEGNSDLPTLFNKRWERAFE